MQEITDAGFADAIIEAKNLVIVDFWAPWCGPCRALAPTLQRAAENFQDVTFLKMNVDENPDIPSQIGVRALPTLVAFLHGKPVGHEVGLLTQDKLEAWIKSLLQ